MDNSQHRGGRQLAESILEAHQLPVTNLQRLAGWSNEVWLTEDVVVRLSSGRFRDSFRHEAAVNELIRGAVRVPEIIAQGRAQHREWMILARVPGASLLYQWPALHTNDRMLAMHQLGQQLMSLHSVAVPTAFTNPWIQDAIDDPDKTRDLYLLAPQQFERLLVSLEADQQIDPHLAHKVRRFLDQQLALFEGDREVLIHGDIHLNNLLWHNRELTLIDFELGVCAAPDRELQCIRDYSKRPELLFRESEVPTVRSEDLAIMLPAIREVYPQLFPQRLEERQQVYSTLRNLLQLYHFAPGSRHDPRPALAATVNRTSW